MTRRVVFNAPEFRISVASVKIRCLKTYGVETNSDATTCPRNFFSLRKQA